MGEVFDLGELAQVALALGPDTLALCVVEPGATVERRVAVLQHQRTQTTLGNLVRLVRATLGATQLTGRGFVGVEHFFLEADDLKLIVMEPLDLQQIAFARRATTELVRGVGVAKHHAFVAFGKNICFIVGKTLSRLDKNLVHRHCSELDVLAFECFQVGKVVSFSIRHLR